MASFPPPAFQRMSVRADARAAFRSSGLGSSLYKRENRITIATVVCMKGMEWGTKDIERTLKDFSTMWGYGNSNYYINIQNNHIERL